MGSPTVYNEEWRTRPKNLQAALAPAPRLVFGMQHMLSSPADIKGNISQVFSSSTPARDEGEQSELS